MHDNNSNEIEARVVAFLDSTAIPYEVVEIDPDFADTAQFCEKYGFPLENSANTIIVASKKKPKTFTASVVRADRRIDVNHTVKQLMGAGRVSFARAEETAELTGMMIGGVTALALPPDLPVYIDPGLVDLDYIILGGGSRSIKIKVSPKIFGAIPNATVIEGLTGS
ncbi:MAG: YbaK/EbsC family protein [Dehalococcoidia bacterium]|nr:YbaK/EbsC family protein [Dehalococcoidia bacterium]